MSRICRSCPCCFYKLEDDPDLEFFCLVSIDGNNSLKQLGSTVWNCQDLPDSRGFLSDHWLTAEQVNKYKDDVQVKYWDLELVLPLIPSRVRKATQVM